MKTLRFLMFIAAVGLFSTVGYANQAVVENNNYIVADQEVTKTPVEVADLPEAVAEALKSADFEGWEVVEASFISSDTGEFYAVKLKKGDEEKKVKFTPQGEVKE